MDSPTCADKPASASPAWADGDGLWVWRLDAAGGPERLVEAVADLRCRAVYVKTRDGRDPYNPAAEVAAAALEQTHAAVYVWAWPYPCLPSHPGRTPPDYPEQQATLLVGDARRLDAAGIILDIETQWSWSRAHRAGQVWARVWPQRDARRRALASRLRRLVERIRAMAPALPLGISTLRRPTTLPWAEMLRADVIMPQVYYGGAPGFARRIRATRAWWHARGAAHLRISGPAWRGARPARAFARALAPDAPADWWALDNLSTGAARIIRARASAAASPPRAA